MTGCESCPFNEPPLCMRKYREAEALKEQAGIRKWWSGYLTPVVKVNKPTFARKPMSGKSGKFVRMELLRLKYPPDIYGLISICTAVKREGTDYKPDIVKQSECTGNVPLEVQTTVTIQYFPVKSSRAISERSSIFLEDSSLRSE